MPFPDWTGNARCRSGPFAFPSSSKNIDRINTVDKSDGLPFYGGSPAP